MIHPAPSAGLSRSYVCFFDESRVDLSDRCKAIIVEAASAWHREQRGEAVRWYDSKPLPAHSAHLRVNGRADEAQQEWENDRLSLRRALALMNELKELGVPEEHITPLGLGSSQPLVPGQRLNPMNRLADIEFR